MWLSAEEALGRLGVKPQTLYANVSRGRIRAKPDPRDPRRSLYDRDDVDRMAKRSTGRRDAATVAAEAIRWGDPVLETRISTIASGRLIYRGRDAVNFSETASLEEVAGLLWQGSAKLSSDPTNLPPDGTLRPVLAALAARVTDDAPSYGRSPAALKTDAASVAGTFAAAIAGQGDALLHKRLAALWSAPEAADAIRRALVLLADHELNASTFAARVAVSTGAPLSAGALAGLATLSGPLHGTAGLAVIPLAQRAVQIGAEAALRERLVEGRRVPAFGHPLYPDGDVRGAAILAAIPVPEIYESLAAAGESLIGERPNVDFALAALTAAYHLPDTAPLLIFALARSVGWLAHMLEQAEVGALIRPRARYTGELPKGT